MPLDTPSAPVVDLQRRHHSTTDVYEILTVDEVAALLKVSKSWVYEHTRVARRPAIGAPTPPEDRQVRALRCRGSSAHSSSVDADARVTRPATTATMAPELQHEEPTRGKGFSRMARSKRQYGSGCLLKRGKGWAIRWREMEIAPDGTRKKVLRYEALGEVTRKQASDTLAQTHGGRRQRQGADAVSRHVPNARGRMGRFGSADVQALDPEASALHAEEAPVAAVSATWRSRT